MAEFCQEFFDDVAIPAENVMGQVNDGWTVASRLLYHERDAVGGGSPYVSGVAVGARRRRAASGPTWSNWPGATGQADDPAGPAAGGRGPGQRTGAAAAHRADDPGIRTGALPAPAGALPRLIAATNTERRLDIGLEIAGAGGRGSGSTGDPAGRAGASST